MDAARHWAGWTPPDPATGQARAAPDLLAASLTAFGLRLDNAENADDAASASDSGEHAPAQPDAFEVWAENEVPLRLFLDCETQWRLVPGMSGGTWQGFDYAGVRAMLEVREVAHRKAVFEDLMLMERAALGALAQLSAQHAGRARAT